MSTSEDFSVTIYGQPYSKANQRRAVVIRGKPSFIKSKNALAYQKTFEEQCPVLDPLIEDDVRVDIHIWYGNRRPDLDESLILDLLQQRVYANDRQVKEKHIYWHLDRERPRATIRVRPLAVGDSDGDHRCLRQEAQPTPRRRPVVRKR